MGQPIPPHTPITGSCPLSLCCSGYSPTGRTSPGGCVTTHPHSWQVPPLGPFMVDGHTAAGTDQPVMSWTSQCLMSPSSVMAQLNEQLGATQGGPRGRHRTALSKNNAEKSMFLLILLKRSHRPHLASEQELKKIQQMGGSSSLPFPQRYTQTGLFFWKISVTGQERHISGGPILLGQAQASRSPTNR